MTQTLPETSQFEIQLRGNVSPGSRQQEVSNASALVPSPAFTTLADKDSGKRGALDEYAPYTKLCDLKSLKHEMSYSVLGLHQRNVNLQHTHDVLSFSLSLSVCFCLSLILSISGSSQLATPVSYM